MGILTIKKDGQFEREYPLLKERIRIGRAPGSDIRLDDPSVSAKHAMIITILNESFVQDTESTNGTFINGDSIKNQELKNGDIIQIGNWEMAYEKKDEDEDEDSEMEETIYDDNAGEKTLMVQRGSVYKTTNTKKFFLKIMSGHATGTEYEMRKSLVTLGNPDRQVAVISRRPKGFFFTHVVGTGVEAPLINNKPAGPTARLLNNDDVIELGGLQIQVIITD